MCLRLSAWYVSSRSSKVNQTLIWMLNFTIIVWESFCAIIPLLGLVDVRFLLEIFPCPSRNPLYTRTSLYVWMDDFFFHDQNSTCYPQPCHQALQLRKVKRMKLWDHRAKCQSLTQVTQSVIIHCSGCTPALYPTKLFIVWYEVSSVRNTSFIGEERHG